VLFAGIVVICIMGILYFTMLRSIGKNKKLLPEEIKYKQKKIIIYYQWTIIIILLLCSVFFNIFIWLILRV